MKIYVSLLLAMLITTGFNCSNASANKDFFPDKRPNDFTVIYSQHGGMLDISAKIYVSKDSSFIEKNRYGKKVKMNFTTTDKMLDELYEVLKKNRFNEIEVFNEKVYDRGGNSVRVISGDSAILVNNSGMAFIDKAWTREYSAITGTITNIATDEWNKQARDFKVIVENVMKDENSYIIFDEYNVFGKGSESTGNDKETILTLKLIDGTYSMNYRFRNDFGNIEIPINGHTGIRIYPEGDKLTFEMIK